MDTILTSHLANLYFPEDHQHDNQPVIGPQLQPYLESSLSYVERVSDWLELPYRKFNRESNFAVVQERPWDNISDVSDTPTEAAFTCPPPTISPDTEDNGPSTNPWDSSPSLVPQNRENDLEAMRPIGMHLDQDIDQQVQASRSQTQFMQASPPPAIKVEAENPVCQYESNPFAFLYQQLTPWQLLQTPITPPNLTPLPNQITDNTVHGFFPGQATQKQPDTVWYQEQSASNSWNSPAVPLERGLQMEHQFLNTVSSNTHDIPAVLPIKAEIQPVSPEYSVISEAPAGEEQQQNQCLDMPDLGQVEHFQTLPTSSENPTSQKIAAAETPKDTIAVDIKASSPNKEKPKKIRKRCNIQSDNELYCTECDRYFLGHTGFTQHQDVYHMGPRPHICTFCGKRFRELERLKVHEKCHNGLEKPYKCTDCPKGFQHVQALRRHFDIHHSKPSMFCDYCGKGFVRNDHLMSHRVSHQNNRVKPRTKKPIVQSSGQGVVS
ncbi:zinc finger protein 184-like [Topomyia yanbarensis]|uniref:zinc finger protein 184-like n=1 Tax=Topomyia yanbarensis TaxID=2498891 RepID=UPI00273A820F|nr:zinc finger protein 184-like [Topomyia yanbarensis]XP_058822755.1 zinc finger protein 184-like [Topomyia yanbarensis]